MKLIMIFVALFLSACEQQTYMTKKVMVVVCEDDTREKRGNFIISCIDKANPKSDEEPEDWLYQCRQMAEDTYCQEKPAIKHQYKNGGYWATHRVEIVK